MSDYLTVSEVAARLGLKERTVQKYCASGKLTARRVSTPTGNAWQIDRASFEAIEAPNERTNEHRTHAERTPQTEVSNSKSTERTANERTPNEQTNDARAIGRLEGLALSGLEKSIALAVENAVALAVENAVALAIAPLAAEIRELRLQVEKLENIGRENAPQAAITPPGDQTPAAQKQAAPRGTQRKTLTAWQRIAARILGIR
jgi:excisionase family DNA binding protein